jgi:uncharacterized protein YdiU (UPF0061 family)
MENMHVNAPHLGTPLANTYARELPGLCVPWSPSPAPQPRWLRFNAALAQELGLDADRLHDTDGLTIFSGQRLPLGAEPVAQAYAGHQFGGFSPRLGDGRALLLGEIQDPQGRRHDVAFKGSGATPFSRGGDGKAAVGPVLREYLISEAMQALGIPTTRTLAAVATGEVIRRQTPLPGAVLTRTAASHIRVGTLQYAASQGDAETLERLLHYVIRRHDPELAEAERPALALLQAVMNRQAALVARWMGVGFIHGVMNTDNMTLSGETIDYGPCAFMEAHHPDTVFSSIDHHGRYAYGNQPGMAQWNLARLAEALLPLVHPEPEEAVALATAAIHTFPALYQRYWLGELRRKLGLTAQGGDEAADLALADDYLQLLTQWRVDHTLGFWVLSQALRHSEGTPEALTALFGAGAVPCQAWLQRWTTRLERQNASRQTVAQRMDAVNPVVIPRNHWVEEALEAASESGDLQPFERLLDVVQRPFDAGLSGSRWAQPAAPEQTACYQTFCGT